jgi:hypothetical protein
MKATSLDARSNVFSESVGVYDYTASAVISVFVPELQVLEIRSFFLVDSVLS